MHKISQFFLGHVLFPLFNGRVPMDGDQVLHKSYLVPPITPRKEVHMYKHFLCRTDYLGENKQKDVSRKAGVPRMASLPLLVQSTLSPGHIPRNDCFLSRLEAWRSEWFMQPFRGQPGPISPGYFSNLLSSLYFLLSVCSSVVWGLQVSNFNNSFPWLPSTFTKIIPAPD